jgi:DNA-binding transcriptional regulator YhcF (GntR family)
MSTIPQTVQRRGALEGLVRDLCGDERMAIIDTHATRDAQLPQNGEDQQHLNRKLKMSNLLDKTISEMRSLGASDNDIAATLRHAVDVLEARED